MKKSGNFTNTISVFVLPREKNKKYDMDKRFKKKEPGEEEERLYSKVIIFSVLS